jgi:hypothetical protein
MEVKVSTVQFLARMSRDTQDKIWLALCDDWAENYIYYARGLVSGEEYSQRNAEIGEYMEVIAELQLA